MRTFRLQFEDGLWIDVVGDARDPVSAPYCAARCPSFNPGYCSYFDCPLHREAAQIGVGRLWNRCDACLDEPLSLRSRYPALDRGAAYIPVEAALRTADLYDGHMKGKGVRFWIYALVQAPLPDGEKQPKSLPCKATRVRKNAPSQVAKEMSTEERVRFSEAMEADAPVWFIKIEGKGWDWDTKRGSKEAETVQACLDWLGRFKSQKSVDGAKLIYAEITNEFR